MSISVGGYEFNARTTVVREQYETVGGKLTRAIRITGLLRGAADDAALIAALDGVTEASSADSPVSVSLRPGRRIFARREGFSREVNGRTLTGQFVIDLRAETAWEESASQANVPWNIGASGASIVLNGGGNQATPPVITLEALGTIVAPQWGDGARHLVYDGLVESGVQLVLDGVAGKLWLDGEDVTPYTTGAFPRLEPGATTLTYTDDPSSSHLLDGGVAFRSRWW